MRKHAEEFEAYGDLNSLSELPYRVRVSDEVVEGLLRRLRERCRDWCSQFPGGERLFPRVFAVVTQRVLRELGLKRFDHLSPLLVRYAEKFVDSVPMPNFAEYGPLAARLTARRLELGLTQKQAARICGVAQGTYGYWERGCVPGPRSLPGVASFLGVSLDEAENLAEEQRRFGSAPAPEGVSALELPGARRAPGPAARPHAARGGAAL